MWVIIIIIIIIIADEEDTAELNSLTSYEPKRRGSAVSSLVGCVGKSQQATFLMLFSITVTKNSRPIIFLPYFSVALLRAP